MLAPDPIVVQQVQDPSVLGLLASWIDVLWIIIASTPVSQTVANWLTALLAIFTMSYTLLSDGYRPKKNLTRQHILALTRVHGPSKKYLFS